MNSICGRTYVHAFSLKPDRLSGYSVREVSVFLVNRAKKHWQSGVGLSQALNFCRHPVTVALLGETEWCVSTNRHFC